MIAQFKALGKFYLNVVRLIEDHDGVSHVQLHLLADDGVNEIVIRAKDNVGLGQRLAGCKKGAAAHAPPDLDQVFQVPGTLLHQAGVCHLPGAASKRAVPASVKARFKQPFTGIILVAFSGDLG